MTSVELVVHVHDATATGLLTVAPSSGTPVLVPVTAGIAATTTVFVPTSTGPSSTLSISTGQVGVDIDVLGYDIDPLVSTGAAYHPLTSPADLTGSAGTLVSAGQPSTVQVTGSAVPTGAVAVDAAVVVTGASNAMSVTWTPGAGATTRIADLSASTSLTVGATVPVTPSGASSVAVTAGSATIRIIALGYWTAADTTGGEPVTTVGPTSVAHIVGLTAPATVLAAGAAGIPKAAVSDRVQFTVQSTTVGMLSVAGGTTLRLSLPYPVGTTSFTLSIPLPATKKLVLSASGGSPTVDAAVVGYATVPATSLAVGIVNLPSTAAPRVTVTDPSGSSRTLSASAVLSGAPTGTWHVIAGPVTVSGVTYFPSSPPTVTVTGSALSGVIVDYADAVPATTKAVPTTAVRAVTGSNPATLTLDASNAVVASIAKSDTLTVAVSALTPAGLLGKVAAVTAPASGSRRVTLASTTLLSGLPQASIDAAGPLGAGDVVGAGKQTSQVLSAESLAKRQANPTGTSPVVQSISKAVKCDSGVSLTITGSITVSPTIDFHAQWGLKGLTPVVSTAVVAPGITETAQLSASVKAAAHCTLDHVALLKQPIRFTPIDIQVGPIPVVLVPQLQFYLDADATVSAKISTSVTQTFTAKAGIGFDHGRYYPIAGVTNTYAYQPPTFTDNASADLHATAEATLLLYGVAGPGVSLAAGVTLEASTTSSYRWRVTSYLKGDAVLSVPLLKLSKSLSLFDIEHVVTRVGVELLPSVAAVGAPFPSTGPGTFQATVRNTGTGASTGTITVNTRAALYGNYTSLSSGAGNGWTCDTSVTTCQFGASLPAGAVTPPLTLQTETLDNNRCGPSPCPDGTVVTADVDVDSTPNGGLGSRTAETTAPVVAGGHAQDLVVVVVGSAQDSVSPGGSVTWTAAVSNVGSQPVGGTTHISGISGVASGPGWTCSTVSGECTTTATVPAGGALPLLTVTTNVDSVDSSYYPVTPSVEVANTADQDTSNNDAGVYVNVSRPVKDLVVVLGSAQDSVSPGGSVTWTAAVSNVGSQPVSGTTHISGISGVASGPGWTCSTVSGECTTTATVPAGGALPLLTITTRVDSSDDSPSNYLSVSLSNSGDQQSNDNDASRVIAVTG